MLSLLFYYSFLLKSPPLGVTTAGALHSLLHLFYYNFVIMFIIIGGMSLTYTPPGLNGGTCTGMHKLDIAMAYC